MVMDIRSLVPGHTKTSLGKASRSKSGKSSDSASASVEDSEDSVSLTGHASQIASLVQKMKASPVLDPDRVSPVKEKVDKGEYEIEYERVADKMLDFETNYYDY